MGFARVLVVLSLVVGLLNACDGGDGQRGSAPSDVEQQGGNNEPPAEAHDGNLPREIDEISLWDVSTGPHLRGANIFITRADPILDKFNKGPGQLGPPYTQDDFDELSARGANSVVISMPGLYQEDPPWDLDQDVQGTLDDLLDMIRRAEMFAIIAARTGPGRNEFGFHSKSWSRGLDFSDHSMWSLAAAQQAWIDMWRYTAARYRDDPIVVGYYLMVEPNASDVLVELEPREFYQQYSATLMDWNNLYPRIIDAVREEDDETPIIVDSECWASQSWLSYHPYIPHRGIVYSFHQYFPHQYTIEPLLDHRFGGNLVVYGGRFDFDNDGTPENFDCMWLDDLFYVADSFVAERDASITVSEFGLVRWVSNGSTFMRDQMELLEDRGINHFVWLWNASYSIWDPQNEPFGLQLGPDSVEDRHRSARDLSETISEFWSRNSIKPQG